MALVEMVAAGVVPAVTVLLLDTAVTAAVVVEVVAAVLVPAVGSGVVPAAAELPEATAAS